MPVATRDGRNARTRILGVCRNDRSSSPPGWGSLSTARPHALSVLHRARQWGIFARVPPCGQVAQRGGIVPSRTPPGPQRMAHAGGSTWGIGRAFDFMTQSAPITVRSAPPRRLRCTYILAVRAAKTSRRPPENVGDTAHDTGTATRRKTDPHWGPIVSNSLDAPG